MNTLDVLLLDSSYPINTRNAKIIASLKNLFPNIGVRFITWNRDGRMIAMVDSCEFIYSERTVGYGNKVKKLINIFSYYHFLKSCNEKYSPAILIASHWDMLFLASRIVKKKQILIYDNLDIPTSNNSFLLYILKRIEGIALRKTDAIIFASRFFVNLYNNFLGKTFLIENRPLLNNVSNLSPTQRSINIPLTISFIGTVRYFNIMKNLVDAVKGNATLRLVIHGDGPDLNELRQYANSYDNIVFTGHYNPQKLPLLYSQADVIWAAYPNKDYNVKYAISNKFHESIAYNIPCIFSDKTLLGDYVVKNDIGLVVNPYNVQDIYRLLLNLYNDKKRLEGIRNNLLSFSWNEKSWNDEFLSFAKYIESIINL